MNSIAMEGRAADTSCNPHPFPLGSVRLCKPTADTHSYVHSPSHGCARAYGVRGQRHRERVRCS